MTRRNAAPRKYSARGLYVDLRRSRMTRSGDDRRVNLVVRTPACRNLMNSDAEFRGAMKAA